MILKDKIQRLLGFFQVLKQDITQVEKAVLDATLRQVYSDAGVHDFPSFRDVPSKSYPILSIGKSENYARVTFHRLKLKIQKTMEGTL